MGGVELWWDVWDRYAVGQDWSGATIASTDPNLHVQCICDNSNAQGTSLNVRVSAAFELSNFQGDRIRVGSRTYEIVW